MPPHPSSSPDPRAGLDSALQDLRQAVDGFATVMQERHRRRVPQEPLQPKTREGGPPVVIDGRTPTEPKSAPPRGPQTPPQGGERPDRKDGRTDLPALPKAGKLNLRQRLVIAVKRLWQRLRG